MTHALLLWTVLITLSACQIFCLTPCSYLLLSLLVYRFHMWDFYTISLRRKVHWDVTCCSSNVYLFPVNDMKITWNRSSRYTYITNKQLLIYNSFLRFIKIHVCHGVNLPICNTFFSSSNFAFTHDSKQR